MKTVCDSFYSNPLNLTAANLKRGRFIMRVRAKELRRTRKRTEERHKARHQAEVKAAPKKK